MSEENNYIAGSFQTIKHYFSLFVRHPSFFGLKPTPKASSSQRVILVATEISVQSFLLKPSSFHSACLSL